MQVIVGRDDGENFGPFDSQEQALDWVVNTMTGEEVLPQYKDEAYRLLSWVPSVRNAEWYLQAKDLAESVDFVVFGILFFTNGDIGDVLDEDTLHAGSEAE